MRGHSVSLQVLGTFILWFGWFGFNSGSALMLQDNAFLSGIAARCAVNTFLSSSAGCVSAMLLRMVLQYPEKGQFTFDLTAAMNGTLTALVAVSAVALLVSLIGFNA